MSCQYANKRWRSCLTNSYYHQSQIRSVLCQLCHADRPSIYCIYHSNYFQQLDGQGCYLLMTFLYIVKVGKEMKSAAAFQKKKQKKLGHISSWCRLQHNSQNHIVNTDMPPVELCDVVARTNLMMCLGVSSIAVCALKNTLTM